MRNVFLTLILVAVVGCCPTHQLTTSTQDSVRVETVIRTQYIPDTLFVEVPAEVVRQQLRDTTSHLETSFALSDARILPDGALFHTLANKPQRRPVPTQKEVVYRDSVVYRDRESERIVEVPRPLTWWQQTQIRGFWIAAALLLILLRREVWGVFRKLL